MNPLIKKQLQKCQAAQIPDFDDGTLELHIPKGSAQNVTKYEVNKFYLVELASYITNPPPDYTLADNWNQGTIPKHSFMQVEVSKIMGKMVRIKGYGYDPLTQTSTNDFWEGWVPQKGIKLISKLE